MNKALGLPCILALAISLFSFLSCEQIGSAGENKVVSISADKDLVPKKAGSQWLKITCAVDWTLRLEFEEGVNAWARIKTLSGSGDKSLSLSWDANETEGYRTLRVILILGSLDEVAAFEMVQTNTVDGEDYIPVGSSELTKWLELPELDEGLEYYNHHFRLDGKKYRNFSFGYDKAKRTAVWVAYPLCGFYMKKAVDRTDEWIYDPKIASVDQHRIDSRGYKVESNGQGVRYDRGHQLPSADRLCCYQANAQTFHFTNSTPQYSRLNQNTWSSLEGKVRSISGRSDTLYVVTGCIVEEGGAPGMPKAYDNDDEEVPVPTAYFKALLYYARGNTFGRSGYSAAGFYIDHGTNSTVQKMSIDALEEKTGLDFFVNLPDIIGETNAAFIEKENPDNTSIWK